LDPSSVSELLAKNEQGQLTQQEFFRIFLISVQNSLTTNQRLSEVEKRLEEAEARIEKVEVVGDSISIAGTEPEKQADESVSTEEATTTEEEPATAEAPESEESEVEEQIEESDITSLVEKAEKLQPRTSRKRAKASGAKKNTPRAKRSRI